MRYEVTWMTYEYDFDSEMDEQCFTSEQFKCLNEALNIYLEKKNDINIEYVRITVILDEFSK